MDPTIGAAKAAQLLRPGGRLAVFSHVSEPPAEVAEPFAAAFRAAAPDSPLAGAPARRPLATYQAAYQFVDEQLRRTGRFGEPEHWRFDWERVHTRDAWLDLLPTTGGLIQLPPAPVTAVLRAVGAAIDGLGGRFTMSYTTLAVTAARVVDD